MFGKSMKTNGGYGPYLIIGPINFSLEQALKHKICIFSCPRQLKKNLYTKKPFTKSGTKNPKTTSTPTKRLLFKIHLPENLPDINYSN